MRNNPCYFTHSILQDVEEYKEKQEDIKEAK